MALETTEDSEQLPEDVSEFDVLDKTGHTKTKWNRKKPEEVAEARKVYDTLTAAGFKAFRLKKLGRTGEQMTSFDSEAERVMFIPAFQGG